MTVDASDSLQPTSIAPAADMAQLPDHQSVPPDMAPPSPQLFVEDHTSNRSMSPHPHRLPSAVDVNHQRRPWRYQCKYNRKGKLLAYPTKPTKHFLKYNTERYELYDLKEKITGTPYTGTFTTFDNYDGYYLFSCSYLTKANFEELVPTRGVRLDDRAIGIALQMGYEPKYLYASWPADFDLEGMVRAERVPLGLPFMIKVKLGDVMKVRTDGGGVMTFVCTDPGLYYGWWRGLHPLMGDAGLQADRYMQRKSWEFFACEGMAWYPGHKVVESTVE